LARLQPFQVVLVDALSKPVATKFELLDRCGARLPEQWQDPRGNSMLIQGWQDPRAESGLRFERSPLRLSSGESDAHGVAVVMAPRDSGELVLAIRRGDEDVRVPFAPGAAEAPVRLRA
jgi:hypothetical protein